MSYYKVRSVDLRDENNITVIAASSNVTPISYNKVNYSGTIEDLFKDFLCGELQLNQGNRQTVHEAFLTALLHLKNKELSVFDLWDTEFTCDNYKKALDVFMSSLKSGGDKRDYFLKIDGNDFNSWSKYGYNYSLNGQKVSKSYIDVLLANLRYENVEYNLKEDYDNSLSA